MYVTIKTVTVMCLTCYCQLHYFAFAVDVGICFGLYFKFCLFVYFPLSALVRSESFVQLEEKQAFDLAIGSSGHAAVPKGKKNGAKEKVQHGFSGEEASITERSKLGGDLASRANAISEGEQQSLSTNKPWKRKRKFSSLKVSAYISFTLCELR